MPFSLDNPEMMRAIIVDHYKNPRNFEVVEDPSYTTIHMDSASCIDDIYIQLKIKDNKIVDCKWHGKGCAISSASTSIMSELILDKTVDEAMELKKQFDEMLAGHDYDDEELGDAICFMNVNRQPSRITCANISWRGLEKAVAKEENHE